MKNIILFVVNIIFLINLSSCSFFGKFIKKNNNRISSSDFFSLMSTSQYRAKHLLSNNPNLKNDFGVTLLMQASGAVEFSSITEDLYDYDTALMIMNNGADVDITDNVGLSALDYAVRYSQSKYYNKAYGMNSELVKILIQKGAPLNLDVFCEEFSKNSYSIVDYNIIKLIFENFDLSNKIPKSIWKSIKIGKVDYDEVQNLSENEKKLILINLCAYATKEELKHYIEYFNMSISNITDSSGLTPLQICAMTGNVENFEFIFNNNRNTYNSNNKCSSFQLAAKNNNFGVCKICINNKVPLSKDDIQSMYMCTDSNLIKNALNSADLSRDDLGNMLVFVNKNSTSEYLDEILNLGINIDCVSEDTSLLDRAVSTESENLVKYTLEKGANPDGAITKYLPVYYAVESENLNILKMLIDKNANITDHVVYDDGSSEKNPIDIAKEYHNSKMVELLKKSSN